MTGFLCQAVDYSLEQPCGDSIVGALNGPEQKTIQRQVQTHCVRMVSCVPQSRSEVGPVGIEINAYFQTLAEIISVAPATQGIAEVRAVAVAGGAFQLRVGGSLSLPYCRSNSCVS